ncbi:MAG: hypothetical protein E7335_02995 [Clostridiales bacterium]|nr:hypothetical protein [Clostridiales bacterium]
MTERNRKGAGKMENCIDIKNRLEAMGEFYAAGLFEEPEKPRFKRFSRAMRRYLENYNLPAYDGGPLYPCGTSEQKMAIKHCYSYTVSADYGRLYKEDAEVAKRVDKFLSAYRPSVVWGHTVGGIMYTHSHPNFRRIVREGLDSYEERVSKMKDTDMRDGLLDVLCGIRHLHGRALQAVRETAPDSELYKALQKVPFKPADTLYEAIVCWNFIYYMDGCDNVGRPDADLIDFYKGEDVTEILRCFFKNVDANNGWSGALGPDYNALTVQCLRAIKGLRRPSLELRVTKDMPQEVWDAALDSIYAGGGSPSLYNEEAYQNTLADLFPHIPAEDRLCFSGGGCTETMLVGMSNVGSLDAGINVAAIFEKVMREALPEAQSFEAFYGAFLEEYCRQANIVFDGISESQKNRAEFMPQVMRTLLIDDCIDSEKEYNAGGARYYWSVVNMAGIINVVDSLLVINRLVFADNAMSGAELLKRMDEGEDFKRFSNVARHGVDNEEANAMAARVSGDLCAVFEGKTPYLGGKFLPSSIQFTTYADAGRGIGATPDGRKNGAPLCDCIGALQGNDIQGVTALLNSAASLCQAKLIGTPVLNVRLDAAKISKALQPLVKGYFDKGGMQMQVTCVSREDMLDAREHPEKYPNLVVRIGGYSEYFTRLSPELQQTVIDRTSYGI